MKAVAITGNIGSGKTTISKIFNYLWDIPIYYADTQAKWLMVNDQETTNIILKLFGSEAFVRNELNKEYIANIIFNNSHIKNEWEKFIHQKVLNDYLNWRKNLSVPYHILESALIIEANLSTYFDYIILVTSTYELRIKRLISKGLTIEDIKLRQSNQIPDYKKNTFVHFIIKNDEQTSLIEQCIHIHKQLISEK